MENNTGTPEGKSRHVRDWIDPTRIYNTSVPAGRVPFLWGLAIYPLVVIFLLLTVIIIVIETANPGADIPDYIGIVTYLFMLAWVTAAVCSCLRRLRYLGMSQGWVWLIVLLPLSPILFLYLLIKSGPDARHQVA